MFTVFRTRSISDSSSFYKNQGVDAWILEKHGEGPEHFALERDGHVIELYPLRKTNTSSCEVIVVVAKLFEKVPDIISATIGYELVSTKKNALLVRDPDGHLINIMSSLP